MHILPDVPIKTTTLLSTISLTKELSVILLKAANRFYVIFFFHCHFYFFTPPESASYHCLIL